MWTVVYCVALLAVNMCLLVGFVYYYMETRFMRDAFATLLCAFEEDAKEAQ